MLRGREMVAPCVHVPLVYRNTRVPIASCIYLTRLARPTLQNQKTLRSDKANPNISAAGQDALGEELMRAPKEGRKPPEHMKVG